MPANLKRLLGPNPWRAIGAWLLTCYLVSVAVIAGFALLAVFDAGSEAGRQNYWGTVTMAPVWGLFAGFVTAVFSALPVWGLVSLFRGLKWPRPLSDLIAGALLSLVLLQLLVGTLIYGAAERPSSMPAWLYLIFLAAGAAAGWTYWRLAGRPGRPIDPAQDAVKARVFD